MKLVQAKFNIVKSMTLTIANRATHGWKANVTTQSVNIVQVAQINRHKSLDFFLNGVILKL